MKKTFVFLFCFCLTAALAQVLPFQIFLAGVPKAVHPIVENNTIYLSLPEVASLFHVTADVDLRSRRIVLLPPTASSGEPAAPVKNVQGSVILGQILLPLEPGVETPVSNVKISVYRANDKYDEATIHSAIKTWILENNSFYSDTHGKISETVSDFDGRFAFSKIPPGNYELMALGAIASHETGYWWVPFHMTKGEIKALQLKPEELTRIRLK